MQAQVTALAKTAVAVAAGCPRRCRAVAMLAAITVHAVIAVVVAVVVIVTVALSLHRRHRQRQQQQARHPAATAAAMVAAVNAGVGSLRFTARRCCPLRPITAASPRRIGIILALAAVVVLPPHPHLPLPPATMGSVAVDVYWHNRLNCAHGLADGALALIFPSGMEWVGGGGEWRQQWGSSREEEGSHHQTLPPSTSTTTSTSSATRARATVTLITIIVVVVAVGIATVSAAAAASKCGTVFAVLDAWLQPGVEAQPAVEVGTAGHNRFVRHLLEADGAWEPPVVASQEALLVIAVRIVVVVSLQLESSLESLLSWRPMQIPLPEGGGAAGLRLLLPSSASSLWSSYLSAPSPLLGTTTMNSPLSSSAWYTYICVGGIGKVTPPLTLSSCLRYVGILLGGDGNCPQKLWYVNTKN
jgi:hypothetical protein